MKDIMSNTEQNFDKKEKGQASTSKYTQAQVPSDSGAYKKNSITGTPDDQIVDNNLKSFTCNTVTLKTQTITILGFQIPLPLPFLKTKNSKEIKEIPLDKNKLQYGNTIVKETRGGFLELISQTPMNKIWQWLHPSGTYRKWIDDGSSYDKVVGDSFTICGKNWNIAVNNDCIEVISGHNKIQIKKNSETLINGSSSTTVNGFSNTQVGKDNAVQVGGSSLETISKDKISDISGTYKENIKKDHETQVNGTESNVVLKDKTDIIGGGLNILVSGDINISSNGNLNIIGSKGISCIGNTTVVGNLSVSGMMTMTGGMTLTGTLIGDVNIIGSLKVNGRGVVVS